MLPEEKARIKIDKQLKKAGWDIVSRDEYKWMGEISSVEVFAGKRLSANVSKKIRTRVDCL